MILGTTRENNQTDLKITDKDRETIWKQYLQLHPTLKVNFYKVNFYKKNY